MRRIKLKKAIYPGTFDPITFGHIDLINRSRRLFEKIIVAVAEYNPNKKVLFSTEERIDMIKEEIKDYSNVEVDSFNGLLVKYAEKLNAEVIIRGLRAFSDFEYEFQMALTNKKLSPRITTVFLMPHEKYTYINSSIIKEVAKLGGDVSCFVPSFAEKKLNEKFNIK